MILYKDRSDARLHEALKSAVTAMQSRFIYSGNVLTFVHSRGSTNLLEPTHFSRIGTTCKDRKVLLMYPFALFSRDRMAVESLRVTEDTLGVGGGAAFDPGRQHWIADHLENVIRKLHSHNGYNFSEAEIKLSVMNPLCSVLVVDNQAFLTPYHYGRLNNESECTANIMPVVHFDRDDTAVNALADHVNYLWNQPTSLGLGECRKGDRIADLTIRAPQELNPLPRIDDLGGAGWIDWSTVKADLLALYSPTTTVRTKRSVFISHPSEKFADAEAIRNLVEKEFFSEAQLLMREDLRGKKLPELLEKSLARSTHAVVLAAAHKEPVGPPKPNVLHELGWSQAKLGHENVLILKYEGAQLPSNIGGVVYERFSSQVSDLGKVRSWLSGRGFRERVASKVG